MRMVFIAAAVVMCVAATCKAGADCIYFETSTGAYDFKTP